MFKVTENETGENLHMMVLLAPRIAMQQKPASLSWCVSIRVKNESLSLSVQQIAGRYHNAVYPGNRRLNKKNSYDASR